MNRHKPFSRENAPARRTVATFVAAAVGSGAVLVGAHAAGWLAPPSPAQPVVLPAPRALVERPVAALPVGRFDAAGIYAVRSPGVVTVYATLPDGGLQQGSGFVVSRAGAILTSSHVITDAGSGTHDIHAAKTVFVEFADHDRAPARIVGWDVFDDVGVLQVDPGAHALIPVPLGDSNAVAVGEPVAAIGSPFGNENSLAVGWVAGVHRAIDSLTSSFELVDAIQTELAIDHGSSGGPLLDAGGLAIGITAQVDSAAGHSTAIGFAVPINAAKRSLTQLLAGRSVAYAYVGLTSSDLTRSVARRLHLGRLRGALVQSVQPDGPALHAGLRAGTKALEADGRTVFVGGDVVVAIGGQPVRSAADLVRIVTLQLAPGERVPFTLVRDGRRLVVAITLTGRPAQDATAG